jgi:hypothetical protein
MEHGREKLKKPTPLEEAEYTCKESARFFAVQLTCLIVVVLDECFRFDKSIAVEKRKATSTMKITIIYIVEVIIILSA